MDLTGRPRVSAEKGESESSGNKSRSGIEIAIDQPVPRIPHNDKLKKESIKTDIHT